MSRDTPTAGRLPSWRVVRNIPDSIRGAVGDPAALSSRLGATIERQAIWVALAASTAIVLAMYRRSLNLTYLFNDVPRVAATGSRNYRQVLTNDLDGSYQPIPGLLWKVLLDIAGSDRSAIFHLLPLVAHALVGWLLFVLLWRLQLGVWAAVPPVLFLTFPFHYQVVGSVASLAFPMSGAAVMASMVAFLQARTVDSVRDGDSARFRDVPGRQGTGWHLAALAATVVALGSHEVGIVSVLAIVGLEAGLLVRAGRRRPSWWIAGHLAAGLVFAGIWLVVSDQMSFADLREKALYALQAITWPVTRQSGWLGGGALELGLIGLVAAGAAYWLAAWRSHSWRPVVVAVVALLAAIVAAVPVVAMFSWAEIERSPRTLYLVAIGAAVLWGLLPSLSFRHRGITRAWRSFATLLLVIVVVQSWKFVDHRMEMMAAGTDVVAGIVEAGERYEGRRMLTVNMPASLSSGRGGFPYGWFGVELIPAGTDLSEVVRLNSARLAEIDLVAGHSFADTTGGRYVVAPIEPELTLEEIDGYLRSGYALVVVRPEGDAWIARDVGRISPGRADPELRVAGTIGESVNVDQARVAALGDSVTIFVDWHVTSPLPKRDQSEASIAIVEVRSDTGEPVFTYAGDALAGFSPPMFWQAGDLVSDSIVFRLPSDGQYTIHAGLQHVFQPDPAPATGADGRQYSDGMLPIGAFEVAGSRVTVSGSVP